MGCVLWVRCVCDDRLGKACTTHKGVLMGRFFHFSREILMKWPVPESPESTGPKRCKRVVAMPGSGKLMPGNVPDTKCPVANGDGLRVGRVGRVEAFRVRCAAERENA